MTVWIRLLFFAPATLFIACIDAYETSRTLECDTIDAKAEKSTLEIENQMKLRKRKTIRVLLCNMAKNLNHHTVCAGKPKELSRIVEDCDNEAEWPKLGEGKWTSRGTVGDEIAVLMELSFEIWSENSTQNKYYLIGRKARHSHTQNNDWSGWVGSFYNKVQECDSCRSQAPYRADA